MKLIKRGPEYSKLKRQISGVSDAIDKALVILEQGGYIALPADYTCEIFSSIYSSFFNLQLSLKKVPCSTKSAWNDNNLATANNTVTPDLICTLIYLDSCHWDHSTGA